MNKPKLTLRDWLWCKWNRICTKHRTRISIYCELCAQAERDKYDARLLRLQGAGNAVREV